MVWPPPAPAAIVAPEILSAPVTVRELLSVRVAVVLAVVKPATVRLATSSVLLSLLPQIWPPGWFGSGVQTLGLKTRVSFAPGPAHPGRGGALVPQLS